MSQSWASGSTLRPVPESLAIRWAQSRALRLADAGVAEGHPAVAAWCDARHQDVGSADTLVNDLGMTACRS
jgi:hypothetical protein